MYRITESDIEGLVRDINKLTNSPQEPLYPWWRCPNCGDKWLYPHQDNIDSSTCDNCAKEQSND
jgi:hypothetical protein